MWKLFLDDERDPLYIKDVALPLPHIPWTIARTAKEAQALVQKLGMPAVIAFDHDLGDGPTGYDFAKWVILQDTNKTYPLPEGFEFFVHSSNPIGAKAIRDYIYNYYRNIKDNAN